MKKKLNENRRAPIALMACDSGRKFANSVGSEMGIDLLPTKETWFACGEGKFEIKSTKSVEKRNKIIEEPLKIKRKKSPLKKNSYVFWPICFI